MKAEDTWVKVSRELEDYLGDMDSAGFVLTLASLGFSRDVKNDHKKFRREFKELLWGMPEPVRTELQHEGHTFSTVCWVMAAHFDCVPPEIRRAVLTKIAEAEKQTATIH